MAKGATHVLGIDIGTQTIKAVELRLVGRSIRLLGEPVVIPTPAQAVAAGRIVEREAVAEALAELLKERHFGTRNVIASVGGDTDVVVRIIEVPRMAGKELGEAIQWELERQISFPVDQATYDYMAIERPDAPEEAPNMEVLLVAAQEDMVDTHVGAMLDCKLTPLAVDVEPLAISRALVDAGGEALENQTITNIHIGATNTSIMIVRKGLLAFVRTIPTAGEQLTGAIREHLMLDEQMAERVKRMFSDLTGAYAYEAPAQPEPEYEEGGETSTFDAIGQDSQDEGDSLFEVSDSEQYLDQSAVGGLSSDVAVTQLDIDSSSHTLTPDGEDLGASLAGDQAASEKAPSLVAPEIEHTRGQVYESIFQPLVDLATEVRRSLDFYRRNHRNETIDRVVISGGTATIPGLTTFLAGEIGMPVEMAAPFEFVDVADADEEYLRDVGPLCVVAVGLAMRDMLD